jgi:holin-like protein
MQGFAIILLCQCAGELINFLLITPIPAPIYGLVALLIWLGIDHKNHKTIDAAGSLLLSHVALFIIPAGVAIISVFQVIADDAVVIGLTILMSTVASFIVCVKVTEFLLRIRASAKIENQI